MQDDGYEDVKYPTPICPITDPHPKHFIEGTWRETCPGIESGDGETGPDREGPWFAVGDRVVSHYWQKSEYAEQGLNVIGTVVETKTITGSTPARQQFRAEGADWCGGGSMWNHSDDYVLAPDHRQQAEQWIAGQVSQLNESELLMVQGVLEDLDAGRPVEHFEVGTRVYANTWGTVEFIVLGTVPWHENGVVTRKIAIRSASGNLTGHIDPSALRRVS